MKNKFLKLTDPSNINRPSMISRKIEQVNF